MNDDQGFSRRDVLRTALVAAAASVVATGTATAQNAPSFDLDEATIESLQAGMAAGTLTARSITEKYLARIAMIDQSGPALHSIIELNPDALTIADAMDLERKTKGPRGAMHGIPVLIKDNIDTGDRMMTTAGSLALVGPPAPRDAHIVERLRAAGAVILGKTNLSEWANIRSTHSTSGWSGRGGLTKNPYALVRNTSGSSSGSGAAAAANLCAVAVGTETDGSIVSPASVNGLVGIKPTVGLLSRAGIIPISHTQDTPGPMTRTVRDAAILLGAMAGSDPRDAATKDADRHRVDYTRNLTSDALHGARLGVVRGFGVSSKVTPLLSEAIETLRKLGAEVVDNVEIPHLGEYDNEELQVLLYELKADLADYLATRPDAKIRNLADAIRFNEEHSDDELQWFGQELFIQAQEKGSLRDKEYLAAVEKCRKLSREGIDGVMRDKKLDALIGLTNGLSWMTDLVNGDAYTGGNSSPAAVAGYPHITVPAGFVRGLPAGLSFFASAWSEEKLIRYAWAYEKASSKRTAPKFQRDHSGRPAL